MFRVHDIERSHGGGEGKKSCRIVLKPSDSFSLGAALNRHIILVSRDESRLAAHLRGDVLNNAGYRAIYAESLGRAVAMICTLRSDLVCLVILEQSYSEREKTAFINCIHESHPYIHVLCLQYGDTRPELLIKACRKILSGQPGGRTVHTLQEFDAKSA